MADIVLKDRQGVPQTYAGYSKVAFNTPDSGTVIFSEGDATENVQIELDLAVGNQTVEAQSGTLMKSAVIKKPTTLTPENVAKDVNVAGVVGTFIGNGVENVEVIPDFSEGDQTVTAEAGTLIKSAIVRKPETLTPENIAKGVKVAGVTGTLSGGDAEVKSGVIFIDYDGSIVESWASVEVADKTKLPSNPSHSRLVAKGWNWDLYHIQDYILEYPEAVVVVGQEYDTASGLTEFDITLNKATGLTVTCNMAGNKTWGDGTSDALTTHTYADYGNYTITCDGTSIPQSVFGQSSSSRSNQFIGVFIPQSIGSVEESAFQYCNTLKTVVLNTGTTYLNSNTFYSCRMLKAVVLPKRITSTNYNVFYECSKLQYASLSQACLLSSNPSSLFNNCELLEAVTVPLGSSYIPQSCFNTCRSLHSLVIPRGIYGMYANAFRYTAAEELVLPKTLTTLPDSTIEYMNALKKVICLGDLTKVDRLNDCGFLAELDLRYCTSVPTLSYAKSFFSINPEFRILVNEDLYDDWIVATNWSGYANYIYPVRLPKRHNRYVSATNEVQAGTTLTTSINCNVGDMIVATFVIRSNVYSISSDWTMLGVSDGVSGSGEVQRTGMCYKFAESASESITVTQSENKRIYTNLVVIQGATGVSFNEFVKDETGSTSITVDRPDGLLIWGLSCIISLSKWSVSDEDNVSLIGQSDTPRCLTALDQGHKHQLTFTGSEYISCGSCTITGIPNFWYYD